MKTFKHFTALFILSVIFLTSCDKENGHTIVKGTVVDNTTDQPVPNSTVYLGRSNSDIWGGGGIADVAQYASDGNGNFEFAFEAEQGYSYALGAMAENYYDNNNQLVGLEKGKKNKNIKVGLNPIGYLKIHLVNSQPYNYLDYVNTNLCAGPFYGIDIDTSIICQVYGNINEMLIWFVEKNSIPSSFQDSIYCPAFDTIEYEILY